MTQMDADFLENIICVPNLRNLWILTRKAFSQLAWNTTSTQ